MGPKVGSGLLENIALRRKNKANRGKMLKDRNINVLYITVTKCVCSAWFIWFLLKLY